MRGVLVLGERDCSVQRRHQKLIEEGPSPALDAATRARMAEAATLACTGCDYRNAGTVEFLLDRDGSFYFIEMNTRLQVEHPVSELVTGRDLAAWQLRIAAGEPLDATGPCRASRPRDRVPDQLRGSRARLPSRRRARSAGFGRRSAPGVRVDTHAYEGYRVPPFYDSLLAKLIVWGEDRGQALDRSRRALAELEIEGRRHDGAALRRGRGGAGVPLGRLHDGATSTTSAAACRRSRPEAAAA